MSNFSNYSAVAEALNSLHRYIRSMHISVELPDIDENALEEYFNCNDTSRQATFDKFIKAAAVDAFYNDPEIPKVLKAKVARRASQELVDAFRGAKVEYEFASGKYGNGIPSVKRYEREKKEIKLCRKAVFIDRIKRNIPRQVTKVVAKQGVKSAFATIGFATSGPAGAVAGFAVGLAVDAIWFLIPKSVKEKIKQKCGDIAKKSADIVKTIGNKITSTPPIKKAKAIVETYVAPIFHPVYEKAKDIATEATSKICNSVRKGWKVIKAVFA